MSLMDRVKALRNLGGAASLQLPENIYAVAQLRSATKAKAQEMITTAKDAGRDFTSAEETEFQSLTDTLEACSSRMEQDAKRGGFNGGPHHAFSVRSVTIPGRTGGSINIPSNPDGVMGDDSPEAGLVRVHDWMRGKIQAADVPLRIQQAPVSSGLSEAIPTTVLDAIRTYIVNDAFRLAGATIYNTTDTSPLVKPIIQAGPAAETFVEGASATESDPMDIEAFTFGGTKYSRLVKVSEVSLMNSALDLAAEITAELAAGVANSFTAAITTALKAAMQSNPACLVYNGQDDYDAVLSLIAAVPVRFEDPSNCFMGSRSDLKKIRNVRASGSGQPLLNPTDNTILGRQYVINDNCDRLYYGNWGAGAYVRKSPYFIQRLIELYSATGDIGFKSTQFLDSKFLASVPSVTSQPLYFTHLDVAGS